MLDDEVAPIEGKGSFWETARERSLRFLDFLDAYHATLSPPVRTLQGYNDVALPREAVPQAAGVHFYPGGDTWLVCDLVPLPPVPEVPEDLASQATKPLERENVAANAPLTNTPLEDA